MLSSTKCFYGIEAEGPYRGTPTLFIPGGISQAVLLTSYLQVEDKIKNFYYGAGGDRALCLDTYDFILDLRKSIPNSTVIIELDDVPDWIHDLHLVVVLSARHRSDSIANYLKTVTKDEVRWTEQKTGEFWSTRLDDELFTQDKEI